ncbi:MAG: DoxX family protein [Acidobacteriota bacterium]
MSIVFLIGRVIVGAYYLYNGVNHFLKFSSLVEYAKFKGVQAPEVAVAGSGLLLLIAGFTLLLGFHPEVGVAALVLFFIPVTFMMHNFWAAAAEQKMAETVNFAKNMALLGSALMFLRIAKPWPLSLSRKK